MNVKDLQTILAEHTKWLSGDPEGKRANLSVVNFHRADLANANLTGADLTGANLTDSNLTGADLSASKVTQLVLGPYSVYIERDNIRIGCQYHTAKEWSEFTQKDIRAMAPGAFAWWTKHKAIVFAAHKALNS